MNKFNYETHLKSAQTSVFLSLSLSFNSYSILICFYFVLKCDVTELFSLLTHKHTHIAHRKSLKFEDIAEYENERIRRKKEVMENNNDDYCLSTFYGFVFGPAIIKKSFISGSPPPHKEPSENIYCFYYDI